MMTVDEEYLSRFSEALVQEIWTEMGRNRITSIRALALKMGRNPQYVTGRLKVDPKTGKPVPINVVDLFAFSEALGVTAVELVERAEEAVAHIKPAFDAVGDPSNMVQVTAEENAENSGRRHDKDALGYIEGVDDPADYSPGFVERSIAEDADRVRTDALARKRQTRAQRRNDFSSFDDSDVAARDEDREKPKFD